MDPAAHLPGLDIGHEYAIAFTCNAALFGYEFLIALSNEIELIWGSKWGTATCLYYACRYSIIPEIGLQMAFLFGHVSDSQCRLFSGYMSFSVSFGVLLGQGIIVLRTWAIWNGPRAMLCCLAAAAAALVGIYLYLCARWLAETQVAARCAERGCAMLSSYRRFYVGWISFYCYDAALICLTIAKHRQERRAARHLASRERGASQLSESLYHDAFSFFAVVLAFGIGSIFATLLVRAEYRVALYCTERVVYTCIACRIIINLRAAARSQAAVSTLGTVKSSDV